MNALSQTGSAPQTYRISSVAVWDLAIFFSSKHGGQRNQGTSASNPNDISHDSNGEIRQAAAGAECDNGEECLSGRLCFHATWIRFSTKVRASSLATKQIKFSYCQTISQRNKSLKKSLIKFYQWF